MLEEVRAFLWAEAADDAADPYAEGAKWCARRPFTYARDIGPLMAPSSTNGATMPRCRRPATDVMTFQCLAEHSRSAAPRADSATAQPHHAGARPGLINKYQSSLVKRALLPHPAPACVSDFRGFAPSRIGL
jgi:hypothetical protein